MAGATIEAPPKEGEPLALDGSVMIAVAESKEEVLEKLHKDIYATSGVWNMDEVRSPARNHDVGMVICSDNPLQDYHKAFQSRIQKRCLDQKYLQIIVHLKIQALISAQCWCVICAA